MSDPIDESQLAEELVLAQALAGARLKIGAGPVIIDGVPCCRECKKQISSARIKAMPMVGICAECAEAREKD